jgi:hypothetical protein
MYTKEFLVLLGLDPKVLNAGWVVESHVSENDVGTDCLPPKENANDHIGTSLENLGDCKPDNMEQVQLVQRPHSNTIPLKNDPVSRLQTSKSSTEDSAPYICRNGCKHYDGVKDVNDGQFKEYCCHNGCRSIKMSGKCTDFEDENPVCDDGILKF